MADSLRILVVLPMYGGSLPIGKYCAAALTKMGHNVRVFNAPELYSAFTGLSRLDITPAAVIPLQNAFLKVVGQAIWTLAREQKSQLVLALAQAPMDRNLLQRMKQAGMRSVMWFVEDYKIFNYWQYLAPYYDAFAVIQKEPFLSELAKAGQPHAFYLPLAALPEFHNKIALSDAEKKEYASDISFLGAGYPNRRVAFRPLAGKNFKIWGCDWEGEGLLRGNIQRHGERIGEDESVKIYNAARINLNLHSSIQSDKIVSGGDFVNPRTFELAAMGAFQLVDKRGLMPELFAPDELATFENLEEFYSKIEYFISHPEEREEYARKSRKRVLQDHTYEKRMAKLLDYMRGEFGPWPQEQDSEKDKYKDIPAEIRENLINLINKLGLAPEASFEEVVGRLRQRTGELNEVETAILFMDEWRKQYSD